MQLTRHHLLEALRNDEFHVHYQPKVDLQTHRVYGAEGLLRWHSEASDSDVDPGDFIRAAERHRLIAPIGQMMIEKALSQLDAWRDEGWGNLTLAINVSLRQLLDDNFVSVLEDAVNAHPIDSEQITIELSDHVLTSDSLLVEQQLQGLSRLGFRLSLDDVGSGEASLMEAFHLPLNEIKVDEYFIGQLLSHPGSEQILARLSQQQSRSGKELVAERVESRGIHEAARQLGCRYGQGFYYGKPSDSGSFSGLLTERADRRH